MQKTAVIVGARRSRQGLGEFITRKLAKQDVKIKAIVGTSEQTLNEAVKNLAAHNIENINTYRSLDEALKQEQPDITVIATPYKTHREMLLKTARAKSHCLCEKPLIWDDDLNKSLAEIKKIAALFSANKRLLEPVTQWPMTLPFFYKIYPELKNKPVTSFSMTMGPITNGEKMLIDSCSHPISMLQSLCGFGNITSISFSEESVNKSLHIKFIYETASALEVAVNLKLIKTEQRPRPAAYAVNGLAINRNIDMSSYTQYFEGGGQKLAIKDPLELLLNSFTAKIHHASASDEKIIIDSVRHLNEIVFAYREHQES